MWSITTAVRVTTHMIEKGKTWVPGRMSGTCVRIKKKSPFGLCKNRTNSLLIDLQQSIHTFLFCRGPVAKQSLFGLCKNRNRDRWRSRWRHNLGLVAKQSLEWYFWLIWFKLTVPKLPISPEINSHNTTEELSF